jgi:hypothetical protein
MAAAAAGGENLTPLKLTAASTKLGAVCADGWQV